MLSTILALTFLLEGPALALTSQETPTHPKGRGEATGSVEVGMRIRLHTDATREAPGLVHVGEVIGISEEAVIVRLDGRALKVTIPRSAVNQVERSQGTIRVGSRLKGALKGLAIGAAAGWLIGELFPNSCEVGPDQVCGGSKDKSNQFAKWLGSAGGVTGALLGTHEVEQWKGASFEAPQTKTVWRSSRGFGASLRISF
ncbi:MAG: hypothetical protein ABI672_20880 [Vicinamibacteria bacterium]